MDQFSYKNLPSAKHNKNRVVQVTDRNGALFRSDGEFWVQQTFDIPAGSTPVVATEALDGGIELSSGGSALKLPAGVTDLSGGVAGGAKVYKDNSAHSITAAINTDEVLLELTVPPGEIAADTVFEVYSQWDMTNSANAKFQKITLNGQAILDISQTTIAGIEPVRIVRCRGAGTQVASNKATSSTFGTSSSSGSLALTADLSAGAVFQFIGKRSNIGDSLTLQSALVEVK